VREGGGGGLLISFGWLRLSLWQRPTGRSRQGARAVHKGGQSAALGVGERAQGRGGGVLVVRTGTGTAVFVVVRTGQERHGRRGWGATHGIEARGRGRGRR
jgi:hypothetical protein